MVGADQILRAKKLAEDFCVNLGRDTGIVGMWLSDVGGVGDVCKVVADSAHAIELLGTTEEVQAEVAEWTGFADGVCDVEDVDSMLQDLNQRLETRWVFAGKGMDITVADLSMFAAVHEILDEKRCAELEKVPHVLRWIDYIQSKQAVYPVIPMNKPKFNPLETSSVSFEAR